MSLHGHIFQDFRIKDFRIKNGQDVKSQGSGMTLMYPTMAPCSLNPAVSPTALQSHLLAVSTDISAFLFPTKVWVCFPKTPSWDSIPSGHSQYTEKTGKGFPEKAQGRSCFNLRQIHYAQP